MFKRSALTPEQALQKLRHYCGYQERSHSEVQEKLYSFGLRKKDVEITLATLIEENYLNEERFALQFAGGHFRLKSWGRVKIRYELQQRKVSEYCIKKALAAIEEEDYEKALNRLAEKKWETISDETNIFSRRKKLHDYLMQKGYESDRVSVVVRTLAENTQ
jgi:regulatory protein